MDAPVKCTSKKPDTIDPGRPTVPIGQPAISSLASTTGPLAQNPEDLL